MTFIAKTFEELSKEELYEILKSRYEIFTIEQNIIYQDMDDVDLNALHCMLTDGKRVAGYLRAFYTDESKKAVKIGRVLSLEHGKGIGTKLMNESMEAIKKRLGCKKILVNAQTQALGFYKLFGFKITSDEFDEAGIPHVKMELELE